MERLQVSVILSDECVARACRLDVQAGSAATSGTCDLHANEPCWRAEAFLVGWWLGPCGGAGWLGQAWAHTQHLRTSRRVDAVLPEVAVGQVVIRALLEEFAGQSDAPLAAEQSMAVNRPPTPLRRLRFRPQVLGFALPGPA